ncbi:GTP-binding nuclear protein Ran-like isoform X2 [Drosophila miranda]|uniref:GTP-binding nuclear protein Ran-like isoform X2 n=1 Tax=Drosophila miranda TaxID=7229 RepID=UPI0007E8171D|nr:GTP-binding nuclear protein Ran-like isoform X2 [Drosophila miranda]
MDVPTYKCIIMGEKHCGKTTFLRRHLTGEFMSEYVPTDRYSVNIDTLIFSTNRGPIRFDVWDWGKEDEELGCYPDDFYSNSHCAILMLDILSRHSSIHLWKQMGYQAWTRFSIKSGTPFVRNISQDGAQYGWTVS